MRHIPSRWLAAASLVLLAALAAAATRPRYGGVLRIETAAALNSLDPARDDAFAPDAGIRDHIAMLVFDRLVRLDHNGQPQPGLATGWEHDGDNRRWQFHLRRGVQLHDGSVLPARLVIASLAGVNPGWRVRPSGDDVVIESDAPLPNLPAQLALPRNSILARGADGALLGSGPFRIAEWQPGRRLLLAENEGYWGGRPFLDRVEVLCSRALRDQALDLQLNRADVVEVSPELLRKAGQEGQRLSISSPAVLFAVVFADRPGVQDLRLRQALSLAMDRDAIQNTLLQKQGEAAADLLPQWVSGYSFLAPANADLARAKQLRTEAGTVPPLTLAYDWSDALAHAIAERIAVNARDCGITLQAYGENLSARMPNADARIVKLHLASADSAAALAAIAQALRADTQAITSAAGPEELFAADRTLRQEYRLVPVVYVPEGYALGPRVRNWIEPREAGWPLEETWLEVQQP